MTEEDATLDDFLSGGSASDEEPETDSAVAEGALDEGDDPGSEPSPTRPNDTVVGPNSDAVDPAVVTARWTGSGARCEDCGDHVERLWRDGEQVVCATCKDW